MSAAQEMDDRADPRLRHIRSFVLRQGRFTPAQQRAFTQHWSRFGLDPAIKQPHWSQVFGRDAPLVLEIGFGNGEQLLRSGLNESEKNFIGIEVHRPGVGRLMNALASHNVDNVRLYNHDAVELLENGIAPDTLDEVRIYFPDPWPKKRQHKRRLIRPEFVKLLARHIKPGGLLHLATDWVEYAQHMLDVLDAAPDWRNLAGAGQYSAQPDWRIRTHFETRGLRLGHEVRDLIYVRA